MFKWLVWTVDVVEVEPSGNVNVLPWQIEAEVLLVYVGLTVSVVTMLLSQALIVLKWLVWTVAVVEVEPSGNVNELPWQMEAEALLV